jgi:hypothetical protein
LVWVFFGSKQVFSQEIELADHDGSYFPTDQGDS